MTNPDAPQRVLARKRDGPTLFPVISQLLYVKTKHWDTPAIFNAKTDWKAAIEMCQSDALYEVASIPIDSHSGVWITKHFPSDPKWRLLT